MADEFLGHELEEWYPMEPTMGPPLPRWLGIYWPWYKVTPTPPPPPPPPPAGLANLYGVVGDKSTGAVLVGAIVSIDGQPTQTGSNGGYTFTNILPGTYTWLIFAKDGYVPQTLTITLVEGNNQLDVALTPTGVPPPTLATLSGVVTDASTGAPLSGVRVSIGILGTEFGGTQATSINPSDSSGYYLITDCGITGSMITLPGTYNVLFRKDGYQSVLVTGVNLIEGQNTTVNAQLAPITQLEQPIAGGAFIGVNGQPFVNKGRINQDVPLYDANGLEFMRMSWPVDWVEIASPVVSEYVTKLIINIIDRTISTPEYQGFSARVTFIPTTAYSPENIDSPIFLYEPGGGFVGAPASSQLPARLDITLSTSSPYVPDLAGEPGVTYDAFVAISTLLANGTPIGPPGYLIRNAIQCPGQHRAYATLYGKVRDITNGQPVSGAIVDLDGNQRYTDSNGNYRFNAVSPGTYALTVAGEPVGYQIYSAQVTLTAGTQQMDVQVTPR